MEYLRFTVKFVFDFDDLRKEYVFEYLKSGKDASVEVLRCANQVDPLLALPEV